MREKQIREQETKERIRDKGKEGRQRREERIIRCSVVHMAIRIEKDSGQRELSRGREENRSSIKQG